MKPSHACHLALLQLAVTVSSLADFAMLISYLTLKQGFINALQLGPSAMHLAWMVHCGSAMAASPEKAEWRSASTMPGAQSVMMDGMMLMLQLSAGSWAITQLVC